jgi:hypothetical protein
MFKSRRMRWAGHVASTGEIKNTYAILLESLKGRCHSEDLGIRDRVTLK